MLYRSFHLRRGCYCHLRGRQLLVCRRLRGDGLLPFKMALLDCPHHSAILVCGCGFRIDRGYNPAALLRNRVAGELGRDALRLGRFLPFARDSLHALLDFALSKLRYLSRFFLIGNKIADVEPELCIDIHSRHYRTSSRIVCPRLSRTASIAAPTLSSYAGRKKGRGGTFLIFLPGPRVLPFFRRAE